MLNSNYDFNIIGQLIAVEFCWIRRQGRHAKAFWLYWSLQSSWLLVARYGFIFRVFCKIRIRNFINNVTLILFNSFSFTSSFSLSFNCYIHKHISVMHIYNTDFFLLINCNIDNLVIANWYI